MREVASAGAGPARDAGLVWLLLLFAAALAVRVALAAATGFDGLYGQDPYAYLDYALRLRAALAALHAPPPFFYPIGYPLLVVPATVVLGAGPLAAQAVSIVAGALAAPACYGLVRAIVPEPPAGALVAGLVVAFAPQAVISSLSVNSDAAAFAFAALSAWALARYLVRPRPGTLAVAAATLGYAVLTRWVYGLAALPWAGATLLAWRLGRVRPARAFGAAVLATSVAGAVVGSQFVGELGRGPISHVGDVAIAKWSPANALHRRVSNPDGAFVYPLPVGVYYLLPFARPAFVFPLLAPLLALGVASLLRAQRPHAVLVLGWLVTMLAFFAGFAWENPRFPLSYFVPLAALVGLGVSYAARRWRDGVAVPAVCAVGLAASALWSVRDVLAFADQKNADLATTTWCRAHVPRDARLLSFGLTETLRHYTPLEVGELADASATTLATWLDEDRPGFLLVDAANLDTQWEGLTPHANLAWLRAHATLAEVGRAGRYTLWRVAGPARGGARQGTG